MKEKIIYGTVKDLGTIGWTPEYIGNKVYIYAQCFKKATDIYQSINWSGKLLARFDFVPKDHPVWIKTQLTDDTFAFQVKEKDGTLLIDQHVNLKYPIKSSSYHFKKTKFKLGIYEPINRLVPNFLVKNFYPKSNISKPLLNRSF